jgi:antitoxin HicB
LGYNLDSGPAKPEEAEMKKLVVVINPDPEDGGYVATVPSLPGVVGQGETEEGAFEDVKAALEFTLESMVERGEELPPGDEVAREIEVAV